MLALTVLQPYAWCIQMGYKAIENRTWAPPAVAIGHRIAIHAGKKWDFRVIQALAELEREERIPHLLNVDIQQMQDECGHVVATALLAGWANASVLANDSWFVGPIGWILKDVVRVKKPIPVRGLQKLWTLSPTIEGILCAERRDACAPGSGS